MAMITRAMKIANMNIEASAMNINDKLSLYKDSNNISNWAINSVINCLNFNVVTGYDGYLNPKNNITRAETVTIMRTMLQRTDLIN